MSGMAQALLRVLASAWPRRGALRVSAAILLAIETVAHDRLGDAAAKTKNQRRRRRKRRKRRRRRRRRQICTLLPSGSACTDGAQCCAGACDANAAHPTVDRVCCRAEGGQCVIGRNECCLDFTCRCTTPGCVSFNGDTGVCA